MDCGYRQSLGLRFFLWNLEGHVYVSVATVTKIGLLLNPAASALDLQFTVEILESMSWVLGAYYIVGWAHFISVREIQR